MDPAIGNGFVEQRVQNLFPGFEPAGRSFQAGADEQRRRIVRSQCHRSFHKLHCFWNPADAFVKFGKLYEYRRRRIRLFQRTPEVTFGQFRAAKMMAVLGDGRKYSGFLGGNVQGSLKAAFGGGIIVTQPVNAAKLEQDAGVGRREAVGAFQGLKAFGEIFLFPRRFGGLEHPLQRTGGD